MKVMVTEEGMGLLHTLQCPAEETHPTSKQSEDEPKKRSRQPTGSEQLSLPTIARTMVQPVVEIKRPTIKISDVFAQKYASVRALKHPIIGEPEGQTDRTKSNAVFVTANETSSLSRLIDKKMRAVALSAREKTDVAEVEAKYQKVLEAHRTHQRRRERILRYIRRQTQVIEQEETEKLERMRNSIAQDLENTAQRSRLPNHAELRRKNRIYRTLGIHYSLIWDETNVSTLAIPKRRREKFPDVKPRYAAE
jgi:hypothetical protein